MTDDPEQKFLAAIAANTNDADARAVYADWLEERGDPRAEYLRLEALLHDGPARLLELTQLVDPSWLATVTRRCDVVLVDAGTNKISVIKVVREVTGLGLKEAKDLVETVKPTAIKTELRYDEAHEIASRFMLTGARVLVMPHVAAPGSYPVPPWPPSIPKRDLWITRVHPERRLDAIKALRQVTELGLKDAKELIDAVATGERRSISVSTDRIDAALAVLRETCDVG